MLKIYKNKNLEKYNTFKIAKIAKFFAIASSAEELIKVLKFAKNRKLKTLILGGGSNILFTRDFNGLVIKMNILGFKIDSERVEVGAGEAWDGFVLKMLENNLSGLENLSLIPGTVGASPVQNIGAYGVEIASFVESVEALNKETCEVKIFSKEECLFKYRDSFFKTPEGKNFIITKVIFKLNKNFIANKNYKDLLEYEEKNKIKLESSKDVRNAVIKIRTDKLPNLEEWGTAGSFWKNLELSQEKFEILKNKYPELPSFNTENDKMKVPLGFVLDKICNLKGYKIGKAKLYEKQALVVVLENGGKVEDIIKLKDYVKSVVLAKIGEKITEEVALI